MLPLTPRQLMSPSPATAAPWFYTWLPVGRATSRLLFPSALLLVALVLLTRHDGAVASLSRTARRGPSQARTQVRTSAPRSTLNEGPSTNDAQNPRLPAPPSDAGDDARVDVCFDEKRKCPFDGVSRSAPAAANLGKGALPRTALIAPLDASGLVTGGDAAELKEMEESDLPQTGMAFTQEDAHASTLLVHPRTRTVVCAYFSGSEGNAGVQIATTALVDGEDTWSKPRAVSFDAERSNQNPVLFWHPTDQAIMLMHTSQRAGRGQGTAEVRWLRALDDSGLRWTKPVTLIPSKGKDAGAFVRNAFLTSADGNEMLLPFYYTPHGYGRFDTHRSTLRRIAWDKLRWSSDVEVPDIPDASDWSEAAVTEKGEFLAQPAMVRLPRDSLPAETTSAADASLVMFFRDRLQSRVYTSISGDDGRTWERPPWQIPEGAVERQHHSKRKRMNKLRKLKFTKGGGGDVPMQTEGDQIAASVRKKLPRRAAPTHVPQNNSGICVLRLLRWTTDWLTDRLGIPGRTCFLLMFNNLSGDGTRYPLSIALSCDGGQTFPFVRDLESGEARDYTPGEFSYPAAAQDPSTGVLHLSYTWRRETIKHVAVDVAWLAGGLSTSASRSAGAFRGDDNGGEAPNRDE